MGVFEKGDGRAAEEAGVRKFRAVLEKWFDAVGFDTKLTVRIEYEVLTRIAIPAHPDSQ